jgi:hypothetical protein
MAGAFFMDINRTYQCDFNWDQIKNPDSVVCSASRFPGIVLKKEGATVTHRPPTFKLQIPEVKTRYPLRVPTSNVGEGHQLKYA